jgi:hypothetical protein
MIIFTRKIKEEISMKRQIRRGVFETNSSSVHSLTMCSGAEYKKWEDGKLLFWGSKDKFGTREDIIEEMKDMRYSWNGALCYPDVNWDDEDEVNDIFSDESIQTCEEFFENEYFETFEESYTTPNGEEVVACGYYGHD